MSRPEIRRDKNGNIHKFWTMEAAEAAEREARERLDARIASTLRPQQTLYRSAAEGLRKLHALAVRISARLLARAGRHPESV